MTTVLIHGQFPELLAEMRRPWDFWKGMVCAQTLIFTAYLLYGMSLDLVLEIMRANVDDLLRVGLFVYSYQGQYTLPLAYQGVSKYAWQTVGNVLALVTGIIAAGLYGNIGIKVAYYCTSRSQFLFVILPFRRDAHEDAFNSYRRGHAARPSSSQSFRTYHMERHGAAVLVARVHRWLCYPPSTDYLRSGRRCLHYAGTLLTPTPVVYCTESCSVHLHLPAPPRLRLPPPPCQALRLACPLTQAHTLQVGELRTLPCVALDGGAGDVRLGDGDCGYVQDGEGDELWVHTTCIEQATYYRGCQVIKFACTVLYCGVSPISMLQTPSGFHFHQEE
jgi:hypothetical protein